MQFTRIIVIAVLDLSCHLFHADTFLFVAKKQSYLQDWFIHENTTRLKNQSLVQCISQCGVLDECMSISHRGSANECIGFNNAYIAQPQTLGYSSAGWSYYLVLNVRCPDLAGYVFSKAFNSCYKVHSYDNTLIYDNYSQICELEGGELMKIDSDEKQQHIVTFLGQFKMSDWIVIQRSHLLSETAWRYNDGSVISYFNWHPTQPELSIFGP
ncbi:Hypothetical predicted protein [Mytilus galloprovincialis]|uniref:C-type lectin domain-containing protein n=1 Tax=Mytilus galloprovincialis TaxID=29158 RepID=A0A8B6BQ32_MYTGA|nr:Hypothetical predicted protein [Mytilus galloprovincialis]